MRPKQPEQKANQKKRAGGVGSKANRSPRPEPLVAVLLATSSFEQESRGDRPNH